MTRLHGGDIAVESPANGGTRFVVTLPASVRREPPAGPDLRGTELQGAELQLRPAAAVPVLEITPPREHQPAERRAPAAAGT